MTIADEIARMKAAAESTRGKWTDGVAGTCNIVRFDGDDIKPVAAVVSFADRRFIAIANPAAILRLVALVERLRDVIRPIADHLASARDSLDGVNGQPDEAEQLDAAATAIDRAFALARAALAAADGTDGARDAKGKP